MKNLVVVGAIQKGLPTVAIVRSIETHNCDNQQHIVSLSKFRQREENIGGQRATSKYKLTGCRDVRSHHNFTLKSRCTMDRTSPDAASAIVGFWCLPMLTPLACAAHVTCLLITVEARLLICPWFEYIGGWLTVIAGIGIYEFTASCA